MSKLNQLIAQENAAHEAWVRHDERMSALWTSVIVALENYLGLQKPQDWQTRKTHSLKARVVTANGRRGSTGIIYANEWAHFGLELEILAPKSTVQLVRELRARPHGARVVVEYAKEEFWIEDSAPETGLRGLSDAIFAGAMNEIAWKYGPPLGAPENPIEWHSGEPMESGRSYTNSQIRGLMPHD